MDRNTVRLTHVFAKFVALRKESVDRNLVRVAHLPGRRGRSPQGERG